VTEPTHNQHPNTPTDTTQQTNTTQNTKTQKEVAPQKPKQQQTNTKKPSIFTETTNEEAKLKPTRNKS